MDGQRQSKEEVRAAVAEAEQKAAAETKRLLDEQAAKVQAEAALQIKKGEAAARATAEAEAKDAYRIREEQIEREKASVEGELAATRRQLLSCCASPSLET